MVCTIYVTLVFFGPIDIIVEILSINFEILATATTLIFQKISKLWLKR